MERTNYVAKAKSLMMATVRTTALVIVPLAAAVNAHAAGVALPSGDYTCTTSFDSSGGSCSMGDSPLADLGSGVQGLSFFTTASVSFSPLSTTSLHQLVITMTDDGALGGAIPAGTVIPISSDFSISTSSGAAIESWFLYFDLGTSGGDTTYGSTSISCLSISVNECAGHRVNTSQLVAGAGLSNGTTIFETVRLTMNVSSTSSAGGVRVDVPGVTSWDFDSVAAVPEPATLGLMATGFALIAWARRRKK